MHQKAAMCSPKPRTDGLQESMSHLISHAYTIWLFTASDIKTIIAPSTYFALVTGLARPTFGFDSVNLTNLLLRAPMVVLWIWSNLLPFNISNQASASSIKEDAINKPWRPLPAGRIEVSTAQKLSNLLTPASVVVSSSICGNAGLGQAIALLGLGYWYNGGGGADRNWVSKNFINACGFVCYFSGALDVILARSSFEHYSAKDITWLLIVFGLVFSTVQSQDFADVEGDRLRQRKTMPLQIGDTEARIFTAACVTLWTVVCCWFWTSRPPIGIMYFTLGAHVATRTLKWKSATEDKKTFLLWNLWLAITCCLPLALMKVIVG